MATAELRTKIDRLWDAFWSGGISNPLEVIEQVTLLMFVRWLDDVQTAKEDKAARTGKPVEDPIYTPETSGLRWSHFTNQVPQQMLATIRDDVFPWLRDQGPRESTYSRHLQGARFTISTPSLLARVVSALEEISLADFGTAGRMYEYMLSRVSAVGHLGQFRTPPHIMQLMVEMIAPDPADEIVDPACGTAGFLVASAEYLKGRKGNSQLEDEAVPVDEGIFHGFDLDRTMLRIASMNMLLHSIANPDIRYLDSLSEGLAGEWGKYSLVLANPPFAGSLNYDATAADLQAVVVTKKTELLFLALVLQLLKPGGRAAVIVPDGVLFGSTKAHKDLRRLLVESHKVDAVVKLPGGAFKPYAGIATAILFFTRTDSGGTDSVWFYDVTADGWSLDDRRAPLLAPGRLGPVPHEGELSAAEHSKNNLPDVLRRWAQRNDSERKRKPSEQSFRVSKADIAAHEYELSINRYRGLHEVKKIAQGEGWRLGDFAEIYPGLIPAAEIDRTPSESHGAGIGMRVLHPSLLAAKLPETDSLPVRTNEKEPRYRLQRGDVVGRDLAEARHWTVLPQEYEGVQAGQGLLVIRVTREVVPPEYLAEYLSSPQAEQQFRRYGVIPRIRRRDLAEILVPACDGDFESIRTAISRLREGVEEASNIQLALRRSKLSIFETSSKNERRIRLEQAADLSSLTAQSLRKQSEPYRIFQETYPYATARAVRKFKHSLTLPEKHEAALQCIESLILSLGIVSLALATHRGRQNIPEIAKWAESVSEGGASLGHWVGVIRAVGADARESSDTAAGLAEATASKKGGKGLMSDLSALVSVRNKIRHGAGPRTRAEIERSLDVLQELMLRSLSASTFLAGIRWVHADRLSWLPDAGKYEVSGLALMGDHPDFEPLEFETMNPLADNSLYMLTRQGEVIPMSPFCILGDCPRCLAPELYYPDKLGGSSAFLKSLDRGHELESDTIHFALRKWIHG
ncbi:N-6 DNA methylase [Actinacidiphila bryophytorum]|uniref:site-specific DNA-methyltransferase (adenine-specific) n=1 Tax=Actinacidiphila bryophytorum TaxID=1436133 RepID=A0A9W4MJF5_9ACTN|nr:N-6 DNA methylase [Actinacidiphila bryophytorum]MBM9437231.1 N-6 DNA methylase [Actinacidiphila bryophytorum]MBN6541751.1 N-6 DNA methylase [Actinacidiphila bryophytorum]CAG7651172.1 Site-specific DNA-methyltransferase (adenine-specific) [Actinacidiphila bryophytorum]